MKLKSRYNVNLLSTLTHSIISLKQNLDWNSHYDNQRIKL